VPGDHLKASYQTFGIAVDWFLETDAPVQGFGPDHPITKEVRSDDAIREFREEWAKADYKLPFSWPHRRDTRERPLIERAFSGATAYIIENLEMCLALSPFFPQTSAIGGVIGSLDLITVRDAGNGKVEFEVYNVTGFGSGSRIPGTGSSIIPDRQRSEWGPGGTIEQYFHWEENKYQGGRSTDSN
jgi:hypothetical protein